MAEATLLIHDLAAAVSPAGSGPLRGWGFGAVYIHSPASIAIAGERVAAVGPPAEILQDLTTGEDSESVDGRGKVALPGLVDCHTHPVFLGDRAAEFELRSSGATYEEIHASGGGIRSTVAATRAGSESDLRSSVEHHLGWMLEHGTTTAEAKSGYGLDRETELKSLRAIHDAGRRSPVDVYPTFLGAHTIPPEFDSAAEYVEFVINEVLPEAAPMARSSDIFL
jgi:imidazolonepropionase